MKVVVLNTFTRTKHSHLISTKKQVSNALVSTEMQTDSSTIPRLKKVN